MGGTLDAWRGQNGGASQVPVRHSQHTNALSVRQVHTDTKTAVTCGAVLLRAVWPVAWAQGRADCASQQGRPLACRTSACLEPSW